MPFRCHHPPNLPCPPAPGDHQLLGVSIDLPIPDISQEGTVRSLAFVSLPWQVLQMQQPLSWLVCLSLLPSVCSPVAAVCPIPSAS